MSDIIAETIQEKYERLKTQLRKETRNLSNPRTICSNQNCLDIVAMGMEVVPFILKDLQKSLGFDKFGTGESYAAHPGWWAAWSLPKMTGAKPEDLKKSYKQIGGTGGFIATNIKAETEAWVSWGIANGIIEADTDRA